MRILIADDDRITLRLLERILSRLGHDVEAVDDGDTAWERYELVRHDLVVSDWMMPGLDGPALVRRIRGLEGGRYAFVILLTSRGAKEDLVQGLEAGADDFLRKPFDPGELGARVRAGERIVQLQASLAARNADLEIANRRMSEDLQAAARIQQAMLPLEAPPAAGFSFAWSFEPCTELAGDIFNVFRLDDAHVGFYLLDVSGHGVPAALLSVTLSRMLVPSASRSSLLIRRSDGDLEGHIEAPASVAERLNHRFASGNLTGQFFTLLYGILDVRRASVRYVSAGHPGAIHLSPDGTHRVFEATGPPIGIRDGLAYTEGEAQLRPGDRLIVYSDGLTEARERGGEQFGLDRLTVNLASNRNRSIAEVLPDLLRAVRAWTGDRALDDDASCLALEMRPRP